jgi:hypothetical protein
MGEVPSRNRDEVAGSCLGEAAVMDGESLEERVVREIETAVELSDAVLAAFVAGEKRETYDVTEVFEYIFANLRGLRRGLQQVARQVEGLPPLPPDAGH